MQAQYGISATPGSNAITSWVNPVGIWKDTALTSATRNMIKAVRVAIVARTELREPVDVTAQCLGYNGPCAWTGSVTSPAPIIDLSTDPNWKKYHYRVFESILPLRNVIWSGGML